MAGHPQSAATRAKISRALKGRRHKSSPKRIPNRDRIATKRAIKMDATGHYNQAQGVVQDYRASYSFTRKSGATAAKPVKPRNTPYTKPVTSLPTTTPKHANTKHALVQGKFGAATLFKGK